VETKGGRVYIMPYSEKAEYKHNRQKPPKKFIKGSLRTVNLNHTNYSGKKFDVPGAKAIVGTLKPQYRTRKGKLGKPLKNGIQSILIPKK
jgi:hypothetical protein